ncbi:Tetrahydroxynaphthalene reductase PfmaG [Frankliniella fusca]|uniref:Tetrahydroxynaphthalene reductase PfmaG n=1 Tax=Frankliniella fusca TaxID=407009 RepID=A0AAE1L772_9NEOP|nr:Tetrahydroxynaphthalene reductase PfmaG [Frankliniella fusca]
MAGVGPGPGRPRARLALPASLLTVQLSLCLLVLVLGPGSAGAGAVDGDPEGAGADVPATNSTAQMLLFREATARVLEAAHGWLNCLLSARPRPPAEIVQCTEQALPHVGNVLAALSTAGWAIRYDKNSDETEVIRRIIQRIADIRTQVHSCVEALGPHLQVSGRCYTVL